MKIKLRVFASIRDICGFDEKELTVPESTTLEELVAALAADYTKLADKKESLLMAVNEEYSIGTTVLKENDTVALFPPVSGG
jgi:molybdopterin converting factor subunit 1